MADGVQVHGKGFFHKGRVLAWGAAAGLILLPLVAMRFTTEVNWTASDFVFATILIGGVGLAYEVAVRISKHWAYRAGAALGLLGCLLTIWVNGAVGIIGSENNPQNEIFFGVLGVTMVGVLFSRFRPMALFWTMVATAAAQFAVFVAAWVLGWGFILPITIFFCAFWVSSGALFRKAADDGAAPAPLPAP
jgi:hypothetical protein